MFDSLKFEFYFLVNTISTTNHDQIEAKYFLKIKKLSEINYLHKDALINSYYIAYINTNNYI